MKLSWLIFTLLLTVYKSNGEIRQQPEIFASSSSTVTLTCEHDNLDHYRLFWYKQRKLDLGLTLLIFSAGQNMVEIEAPFNTPDSKYNATRPEVKTSTLKIMKLQTEDSALYYCATTTGGSSPAYFGNGTKLTVLDPKIKVSERDDINVTVIRPSGQESCKKTVTLVCVARNFYPDHVSIQWMVGSSSRTDGVATDPYATKQGEDVETFTISSRLKVPIREWQNAKNKFKCQVLFYNGTEYLEREDAVYGIAGSDYTREDYIQSSQVMKLAYGMFIAKSGLYGLVIFVFVWRKGSSGK